MAKKKATKKATQPEQVTLYARILGSRQFDPVHAERLLKMKNPQWSETPFEDDVQPIESSEENAASIPHGTEGAEGKETGS